MTGRPRRGTGKPSDPTRRAAEPYQPGNLAAMKTGVFSPRIRAAKAAELEPAFREWLVGKANWAVGDEFELQRRNYLRSLAVVELLADKVDDTLAGNTTMSNREIETYLSALRGEREALALLGVTVQTKAQLAQTVAQTADSLADLQEAGAAALARRREAK